MSKLTTLVAKLRLYPKQNSNHIQTGVLFIPIVPFLGDSDDDLEDMIKQTKVSGADYILFGGGMSMRDNQALWFLKHLNYEYPELLEHYEHLYQFKYDPQSYEGTYEPRGSYLLKINKKMVTLCEKYNLPFRIKRFIPNDFRRENYIIAEQLLNKAYRLQILGKVWTNTHWAGMNIQNLKESLADIAQRNELRSIRNVNREIEIFVRENIQALT